MAELFVPKALDLLGPALQVSEMKQKQQEFKALQDYRDQMVQQQQAQNNQQAIRNKLTVMESLAKGPEGGKAATEYYNANLSKDLGGPIELAGETDEKIIYHDKSGQPWEYMKRIGLSSAKKVQVPDMINKESLNEFQTFSESFLKDKPNASGQELVKAYEESKKVPSQNVTIKQESAEAQEVGKGLGQLYNKAQESATLATDMMDKISRTESLLRDVNVGKLTPIGTEIAAFAQSLGFKIDPNIGNKQAVVSIMKEFALTLRNPSAGAGMPGQMSDQDRKYLASIPPGIEKTPEGNAIIIATWRKVAGRRIEYANAMDDYRAEHGSLDGFSRQWRKHVEANPLFPTTGGQGKESPQAPKFKILNVE
jgi:hypothetical protein